MSVEQYIEGFKKLGQYLREIDAGSSEYTPLFECIQKAYDRNGWFTLENCLNALRAWGEVLQAGALQEWTNQYNLGANAPKNIGLILAGNIPLVGFHDILCVLLCEQNATIKLSTADTLLIPFLYQKLKEISPLFENRLHFTQERLENFDA